MQSKLIEENYVLKETQVFELSMLPKSLDPDFSFIHFLWNLYFLVSHLPFFCERDRCKLNTQIKPDLWFPDTDTVSLGWGRQCSCNVI